MVQAAQDRNRAVDEAIAQLRDDSANRTASMDSMRSDISNLQSSMTTLAQMIHDLTVKVTSPPHPTLVLSSASAGFKTSSIPLDPKPTPTSSPTFHQTPSAPALSFHQTTSPITPNPPPQSQTNQQSPSNGRPPPLLTTPTSQHSQPQQFEPTNRLTIPDNPQVQPHQQQTHQQLPSLPLQTEPENQNPQAITTQQELQPQTPLCKVDSTSFSPSSTSLTLSSTPCYRSSTGSQKCPQLIFRNSPIPISNSMLTHSSPIKSYDSTPEKLQSFFDTQIEFAVGIPDISVPSIISHETALSWFTTNIKSFSSKIEVVTITVDNKVLFGNNIDMSTSIITTPDNLLAVHSIPFEIDLIAMPLINIARIELNMRSKGLHRKACIIFFMGLGGSKPLIFDPGGKMEFKSLFMARFKLGDVQLHHNPSSTISIPQQPTYDLEDKVIFEGSVMIRY